jgi:hypothetical protein
MIITENAAEPVDFVIVPGAPTKDGELSSPLEYLIVTIQLIG